MFCTNKLLSNLLHRRTTAAAVASAQRRAAGLPAVGEAAAPRRVPLIPRIHPIFPSALEAYHPPSSFPRWTPQIPPITRDYNQTHRPVSFNNKLLLFFFSSFVIIIIILCFSGAATVKRKKDVSVINKNILQQKFFTYNYLFIFFVITGTRRWSR